MSVSIAVDDRQWRRAIAEYAVATKKDTSEILNRQMKNLAIKGIEYSKVASRAAIESLEGKDWWPKLIARIASKRAAKKVAKKISEFTEGKRRRLSARAMEVTYTREQARRISRGVIRRRIAAITYMRFFFVAMAKAFGGAGKGKVFKGFQIAARAASPASKVAECLVGFAYKRSRAAAGAEGLIRQALSKAIPAMIRDMRQYAERKMMETARRHSAT